MNSNPDLIEDVFVASTYAATPWEALGTALKTTNGAVIQREYNPLLDGHQNVGWSQTAEWNELTQMLFTPQTLAVIREKVAQYLTGLDEYGRKIVPSDNVITTALWGVFQKHQPRTGDIYGKYTVVDMTRRDDYAAIVDKTISLLVRGISTDIGMQQQNWKLNIWDATVLGDFNQNGLRRHSNIKVKERRADPFLFHMKY